jgi:hypothetical protein
VRSSQLMRYGAAVGWLAHWVELLDDPENKIVRPRQVYLGHDLRYAPHELHLCAHDRIPLACVRSQVLWPIHRHYPSLDERSAAKVTTSKDYISQNSRRRMVSLAQHHAHQQQ